LTIDSQEFESHISFAAWNSNLLHLIEILTFNDSLIYYTQFWWSILKNLSHTFDFSLEFKLNVASGWQCLLLVVWVWGYLTSAFTWRWSLNFLTCMEKKVCWGICWLFSPWLDFFWGIVILVLNHFLMLVSCIALLHAISKQWILMDLRRHGDGYLMKCFKFFTGNMNNIFSFLYFVVIFASYFSLFICVPFHYHLCSIWYYYIWFVEIEKKKL
jgi:hypothetical protein